MPLTGKNKTNKMVMLRIMFFVLLDLITKQRIFGQAIDTDFISPVLNAGSAWSLNIDVSIIIAVSILICFGIIYLYKKGHLHPVAFILLFSGALGNLYDRFVFQGVRDRIDVGFFPVFNLADVFITFGVMRLALQFKKQSRAERAK